MKTFLGKFSDKPVVFLVIFFLTFQLQAQVGTSEESLVITSDDANLVWGPCPEFMPAGCDVTVLHGDPAKGDVDILFRLQPNTEVPNHWHTSAERMVLVSGEMEVSYEGEDTRILKAGDYAYGPAKKPHTAKCGDSEPCVLFIAFIDPIDAFAVSED